MEILISDEKAFFRNTELGAFRRAAKRALAALGTDDNAELSITFIDDREMRGLNSQYRNLDRTTDVLSFPQGDGEVGGEGGADSPLDGLLLGDVVISIDTAGRNARRYGVTLRNEVLRLIVHGTLHLLGYDHKRPAERVVMRAKEKEVMGVITGRR